MIESDLSREWTAFGGASLALMGAALALGARGHARDNIAWQRERGRLVGAPEPAADARVAGASLALLGAGFAAMKVRRGSPHGERGADLAVWLLCALWIVFGLRLAWGTAR